MATPALVIGIGSLIMSGIQVYQQMEAAGEAEDIGRENARRIQEEADEESRREKFNLAREKGLIRAKVAAAGISGITPQTVYEDYISRRESEIQWLQYSGEARADLARKEGRRARNIGYAAATGAAASGIGGSYNWFSKYVK